MRVPPYRRTPWVRNFAAVISPGLQDRMIAGAGITAVFEIASSHSPFLAQPRAVTDILLKAGKHRF